MYGVGPFFLCGKIACPVVDYVKKYSVGEMLNEYY